MERSGRQPSDYVGQFELHIDSKARIILPGTFRQALGKSFIISAGFDRCLFLYEKSLWIRFVEREIEKRSDFSEKARRASRFFHASAHHVSPDAQGRFVIPPPLRAHAMLEKEIVVNGVRNRVEIWDRKLWLDYSEKTTGMIEEIAEELAKETTF